MTTDETRSDKPKPLFTAVSGWCDSLYAFVDGKRVWINQQLLDDWKEWVLSKGKDKASNDV